MTKQGQFKNCERCHKAFYEWPYLAGKRRFCSKTCSNRSTNTQQSQTKRKKSKLNLGHEIKWRYNVLYKEWRNLCIARDKSTCQNCNKPLRTSQETIVHHIESWKDYPNLRYAVSNGQTLCRVCHNKVDKHLCRGRYGYK